MSKVHAVAADYGLQIEPAQCIEVFREPATLWNDSLAAWKSKTKLQALCPLGPGVDIPAFGCLVRDSVVVCYQGKSLNPEKDFVVDHDWAAIALTERSSISSGATVEIDYTYSLRRLDAWIEQPDGTRIVRRGLSDLTVPQPPEIFQGERRIANIYIDYHQTAEQAEIFWMLTDRHDDSTMTTPGRLPRTVAKLRTGQPVRIVCWGDSVTGGGDVSLPEFAYPHQFQRLLCEHYPDANVTVDVIAVGGSESRNWIEPEKYQHPTRQDECRWERIVEARPDVVTIEFVNDDQFDSSEFRPRYEEILHRLRAIDAEVVLVVPHFTAPGWMWFESPWDAERRGYVFDLLAFAAEHHLAVADVSSRWGALWKHGLPYPTLLKNGINHPDDRGHTIFAEELVKCFL